MEAESLTRKTPPSRSDIRRSVASWRDMAPKYQLEEIKKKIRGKLVGVEGTITGGNIGKAFPNGWIVFETFFKKTMQKPTGNINSTWLTTDSQTAAPRIRTRKVPSDSFIRPKEGFLDRANHPMAREISDGGHEPMIACPNQPSIAQIRRMNLLMGGDQFFYSFLLLHWCCHWLTFSGNLTVLVVFQIGGAEDVTIFVSSFAKNKEGKLVYVCGRAWQGFFFSRLCNGKVLLIPSANIMCNFFSRALRAFPTHTKI